MISHQDLNPPADDLSIVGYPAGSEQVADWSFVFGPNGPVCAVDPDHYIMFPDQSRWSLLDMGDIPSWKVAASIAAKQACQPAKEGPIFSPHRAFASLLSDPQLFSHEALGGRILDHEVYGPGPVLKNSVRMLLEKASACVIPGSALALSGRDGSAAARLLNHMFQSAHSELQVPRGPNPIDLVVVWSAFVRRGKRHPAGMIIVTGGGDLTAPELEPLMDIAPVLGIEDPVLLSVAASHDLSDSGDWALNRLN